MENKKELTLLLEEVADGKKSVEEAVLQLREIPFEDLGYAKTDLHRGMRQGMAEVIYGAGKTPEQILGIVRSLRSHGQKTILITRMNQEARNLVADSFPLEYEPLSSTGIVGRKAAPDGKGTIVVATGGTSDIPVAEAVPVKKVPAFHEGTPKFTKIEIVCKEARLEALKDAMLQIGITGMTVSHVLGCGVQKGKPEYYRGVQVEATLLPKVQVDIVVSQVPVRTVIETAKQVLYTGHIGDGKIFVYDVENVIKVRTGEEGFDALQDVE